MNPPFQFNPSDEQLIVRPSRSKWHRLVRWLARNGSILCISVLSAMFSGWQAFEARSARIDSREAAKQAREDAERTAKQQLQDVREARDAARDSAAAAKKLAEGMDRSARASELSARAGRDALTVSRQALRVNEAPLLAVVNATLTLPLVVDQPPKPMFRVLNAGKGPATNIRSKYWFRWIPASLKMDLISFPSAEILFPDLPPSGTLAPTLGYSPPFAATLTTSAIDQIGVGTSILYFYGEIRYGDILDPKRVYQLNWCFVYSPKGTEPQQLVFCREHNGTTVSDAEQ